MNDQMIMDGCLRSTNYLLDVSDSMIMGGLCHVINSRLASDTLTEGDSTVKGESIVMGDLYYALNLRYYHEYLIMDVVIMFESMIVGVTCYAQNLNAVQSINESLYDDQLLDDLKSSTLMVVEYELLIGELNMGEFVIMID